MSGIGAVLDIANGALASASYGIDVTGHNIANVNTVGYSRQTPVQEAKEPVLYNGLLMGRGVTTSTVTRISEQMIENRLMMQGGDLAYTSEMEKYAKTLEGIFTESASTSVSSLLNDYWNLWHDVANNPSGAAERIALREGAALLSDQFQSLNGDLKQLATDLTNAISPEVDKINQLTQEIAQLNNQIVGMEITGVANDLRDKRNTLTAELAKSIDVKSFEQENGALTIVSAKGCTLVHQDSSYDINLGGVNGDRVEWRNSAGAVVDITDHISSGRMGGWLEIRDEVLVKVQLDMDSLAGEFIWQTNQQHSQGIGLEAFGNLAGDHEAVAPAAAMGTAGSGMAYGDRIQDGSFQLWVYDMNDAVAVPGGTAITIDADVTSLNDVAAQISGVDANISAAVVDGQLQISGANGYTFAFSDDSSGALAAMGVNGLFKGTNAGSIGFSDNIGTNSSKIAAARIQNDGTYSSGDNANAISIMDLQLAETTITQWSCDRLSGNMQGSFRATIDEGYHAMAGSIGAVSAGISKENTFNEEMVNSTQQIRDSVSGVSLDEEMTNLIKFQHAYSAAAKLINTADEMMVTLLEVR